MIFQKIKTNFRESCHAALESKFVETLVRRKNTVRCSKYTSLLKHACIKSIEIDLKSIEIELQRDRSLKRSNYIKIEQHRD